MKTGTARGGADVVIRLTATANGNLQDEEYFGGDNAGLDTASAVCTMTLPATRSG